MPSTDKDEQYESGEVQDIWLPSAKQKYPDAKIYTDVTSLDELVKVLEKNCADKSIKKLILSGHNAGRGMLGQYTHTRGHAINERAFFEDKKAAALVASKLAPGALVDVQACNAGNNQDAMQLLANLLKADVRAIKNGWWAGIDDYGPWHKDSKDWGLVLVHPDDQDPEKLYAKLNGGK